MFDTYRALLGINRPLLLKSRLTVRREVKATIQAIIDCMNYNSDDTIIQ